MTIAHNIRKLRTDADLTQEQLAKELGVTRASVTQWETGFSVPRMDKVEKIAGYFSVDISDVVNGVSRPSVCNCVDVPYFGAIAAGTPLSIDTAECTMACPEPIIRKHPEAFFLRVSGGSMDRVIPDGALALIDPTDREPMNNHIYAVCVNGYDATLKRVRKLANGLELVPDSTDPTQRSIIFDYSQDHEEVTIAGRLVWYMAPFDYEI